MRAINGLLQNLLLATMPAAVNPQREALSRNKCKAKAQRQVDRMRAASRRLAGLRAV